VIGSNWTNVWTRNGATKKNINNLNYFKNMEKTKSIQTDLFIKSIEEKFNAFDRKNPHVYEKFKKYAFELIQAGKNVVPHILIMQRLRWDYYVQTTDDNSPFKINNDYVAYYGRKFVRQFPEYTHKFRFRMLKA
jgi:hypothetical protein